MMDMELVRAQAVAALSDSADEAAARRMAAIKAHVRGEEIGDPTSDDVEDARAVLLAASEWRRVNVAIPSVDLHRAPSSALLPIWAWRLLAVVAILAAAYGAGLLLR